MSAPTAGLTRAERYANLRQLMAEGRLTRQSWTGTTADGRATACLYAALVPECDDTTRECPADTLPQWLADCVPWIDDSGTVEAWPAMVQRFATATESARELTPRQWDVVRDQWLRDCLAEAESHVTKDEWSVRAAVATVDALLVRRIAGEDVTAEMAASRAACGAAGAAAAAWASCAASRAASSAASRAAARAASSAAAWAASSAASSAAAGVAAVDRLTAALFTRIETAVTEATL